MEDRDLNATDGIDSIEIEDEIGDSVRRRDGQPLGENRRKVLQAITVESLKHVQSQEKRTAIFATDRVMFRQK